MSSLIEFVFGVIILCVVAYIGMSFAWAIFVNLGFLAAIGVAAVIFMVVYD